jgi:hypothetical protein
MRGKKVAPSTQGTIVAAVDQAKRSGAAGDSTAALAPAGVTASGGGGQLGRCGIESTRR